MQVTFLQQQNNPKHSSHGFTIKPILSLRAGGGGGGFHRIWKTEDRGRRQLSLTLQTSPGPVSGVSQPFSPCTCPTSSPDRKAPSDWRGRCACSSRTSFSAPLYRHGTVGRGENKSGWLHLTTKTHGAAVSPENEQSSRENPQPSPRPFPR